MGLPVHGSNYNGETVYFTVAQGALGPLLVGATDHGLCALWWGGGEELEALLRERFPGATLVRDDGRLAPVVQGIEDHLQGRGPLPNVPIDARGTGFQRRVWDALRAIPPGEVRTYKEVAGAIGQPRGARAVARACAANPVALFIPCHRVVGADGRLRGYRWGVQRKEALLARGL